MRKNVLTKHIIPWMLIVVMLLGGCSSAQDVEQNDSSVDTSQQISDAQDIQQIGEENSIQYYLPTDGKYVRSGTTDGYHVETEEEAIEKGKTIITLVTLSEYNIIGWIASDFNHDNDCYHVEVRTLGDGYNPTEREKLKIQLATGEGPDLVEHNTIDSPERILQSGCFVDLTDFLNELEGEEELFFPSVRAYEYEDRVYAVCTDTMCDTTVVREDVLGGTEIPSFEDFIDRLLNYEKDSVFWNDYQDASDILRDLMRSSDTLRGTVDRENRTCDFSGELFSKLLDVSKRYGEAKHKGYTNIIEYYDVSGYYYPGVDALANNGWVTVNDWYDDGNYPTYVSGDILFINSNSKNIEGAKVFISYALSGYGQSRSHSPVNKDVFDAYMIDRLSIKVSGDGVITENREEIIKDARASCSIGRYRPIDNSDILDIILEESGAYFSGDKSKDEVIKVIESRVQLILDE